MIVRVLVVEDDEFLRDFLVTSLGQEGFTVRSVSTGRQALEVVQDAEPSIVILDLTLPDMDGEEVCTEMKKIYPDLPIIILSARSSVSEIVKGLKLGADDYITKPFKADELLARIKARLRENSSLGDELSASNLLLDSKRLEVFRDGKKIDLTHTEFQLLHFLLSNKGKVLSRDAILSRVWGNDSEVEDRVVDVYIGYLRKKIDSGYDEKLISSVRGFGYLIKV